MKVTSLLKKKKVPQKQHAKASAGNDDCPMCVVSPEVVQQLKKKR